MDLNSFILEFHVKLVFLSSLPFPKWLCAGSRIFALNNDLIEVDESFFKKKRTKYSLEIA